MSSHPDPTDDTPRFPLTTAHARLIALAAIAVLLLVVLT